MNVLNDLKKHFLAVFSALAERKTHSIEIGRYGNGTIEHKFWRDNRTRLFDRAGGKPAVILYNLEGKVSGYSYCEQGVWKRRIRFDDKGQIASDQTKIDGQWVNTPRPVAKPGAREAAQLAAC